MKTLLIIDGNAIVHRAFHALPPLTNPSGELVNAVYGFFSMLLKVIEEVKPSYLAVCFDRPVPTFRKGLYAGYQANRPEMADGLSPQFALLHDALEKSHIAIFEVDRYEADDVIGTLAKQAVQFPVLGSQSSDKSFSVTSQTVPGKPKIDELNSETTKQKTDNRESLEIIILSGDRDLLQLINSHVKVMMPVTGISKMLIHDEASVEEKYGIKPSQFIDYKALIGDASDGYPGVTGIGPKTAAHLLQDYTSFENLYQHIRELPEKYSLKLATDAEQAALAKTLATIVTDVPVHLDLDICSMEHITKEDMKEVFKTFGFNSLQTRVDINPILKSKEGQLGLL